MATNQLDIDHLYITIENSGYHWRDPDTGECIFSWFCPDDAHLIHPSILDQIVRTVFKQGYQFGLTASTREALGSLDESADDCCC